MTNTQSIIFILTAFNVAQLLIFFAVLKFHFKQRKEFQQLKNKFKW